MNRTALAATAAAAATLTATLTAPPTASSAPTRTANLIVAVHTDDEMTLSALWANKPETETVFLWLDVTEKGRSKRIDPATGQPVQWEPGEYNPLDFPGGMDTGYYRGSLANLLAMRKTDPSIPRLIYDKPTLQFTERGRSVVTWNNPGRGHGIKYGYQGREVTALNTRRAINDITSNPAKFGLPTNLAWNDLISSNYYNRSGTAGAVCDPYANPFHGNANTGVSRYSYPQFAGRKAYAICKADPGSNKAKATAAPNTAKAAYGPRGSIPYYFGWLYHENLTTETTRSGVFSTEQWYAHGPARAGHPR